MAKRCIRAPDYLGILIGINDVWRHFDETFCHPKDLVSLNRYQANYQQMIDQTKENVKEIFVIGPFMFEENRENSMRKMVDDYGNIAQKVAETNHLVYVDVQKAIDHYLTRQSSYTLSLDRVHPNRAGHMLVANVFLKAIAFNWQHKVQ